MKRLLVTSNCNTPGLADSFRLLGRDVDVTEIHMNNIRARVHGADSTQGASEEKFSIAFVIPQVLERDEVAAGWIRARSETVVAVPHVVFAGYHPDMCYARDAKGMLKGPVSDYHSGICIAAFKAGLGIGETKRLYNYKTYESAGYFDVWAKDRDAQIAVYRENGIDISTDFMRWSKKGPFMYSMNHPTIAVLFDIARKYMERIGVEQQTPPFLPPDSLAGSAWYPVYPEIAENCGVRGSMLFKRVGEKRLLDLDEFLAESFRIYEGVGRENLINHFTTWDRFQALQDIIG